MDPMVKEAYEMLDRVEVLIKADAEEIRRLREVLQSAQELRIKLLGQLGYVPECVLDFCNKARAALAPVS